MNTVCKELQDPEDEFINGLNVAIDVTEKLTSYNLEAPQEKGGGYLVTLYAWNRLPHIMPVCDVVSFLYSLCKHHPLGMDKEALEQVIKDAISRKELSCWMLSHLGHWEKQDHPPSFKPALTFFKDNRFHLRLYWISSDEEDQKNGKSFNALQAALAYLDDRIKSKPQSLEQVAAEMYKEHQCWRTFTGIQLFELVQLLVQRQCEIPSELKNLCRFTTKSPQQQPVPRSQAQEQAILTKISAMGYQTRALPKAATGKPGVKSEIKRALGSKGIWTGKSVFDKAWQRLMAEGRIAYEK